jgi:UDP-N-acetylglucosamine--N-acetylmuramyl-(pentapeptide) pyrophosphoryl-undecaprenol N-acetylglucosamine transferase
VLADKLIALLADPAQLTRAATAAAGWAIPEAAEKLADAVLGLARERAA